MSPESLSRPSDFGTQVEFMKLMMICDYPMNASEINGGVAAAASNLVQALLKYTAIKITVIGYWREFLESEPAISDQDRLRVI